MLVLFQSHTRTHTDTACSPAVLHMSRGLPSQMTNFFRAKSYCPLLLYPAAANTAFGCRTAQCMLVEVNRAVHHCHFFSLQHSWIDSALWSCQFHTSPPSCVYTGRRRQIMSLHLFSQQGPCQDYQQQWHMPVQVASFNSHKYLPARTEPKTPTLDITITSLPLLKTNEPSYI